MSGAIPKIQIYSTDGAASVYATILLFGLAGAGKTPIAATAPNPIIISSEPGLKSLQGYNLPYVHATTYAQAKDVRAWLVGSKEAQQFHTVFFDSISALSENILVEEKKLNKDPRKFSPETTAKTMEIVRSYLTIPNKHAIMTCKAVEREDQITMVKTVVPYTAVPKLAEALPYHFDAVLYLSRHNDANGAEFAAFRCRFNDLAPACRIRAGKVGSLDLWEPANLTQLINKMNGVS